MSVKSYIAHPFDGMQSKLLEELSEINECEVVPAKNQEIIIVVTETDSPQQEEELQEKLNGIKSLKLLSMVSGFDNNTTKDKL